MLNITLSIFFFYCGLLWRAAVVMLLWNWFAVSYFAAPRASVLPIAGLLLLKEVVHATPISTGKSAVAQFWILPLFALALGWFIKLWL